MTSTNLSNRGLKSRITTEIALTEKHVFMTLVDILTFINQNVDCKKI